MSATHFKVKTTWQLDSPFPCNNVPKVSAEHLNIIVKLLCTLISPIGKYRLHHIKPSKGKRLKKRNRKDTSAITEAVTSLKLETPAKPEIFHHVIVGLNQVLQKLESLSGFSKTQSASSLENNTLEDDSKSIEHIKPDSSRHLSAIFISTSSQPAIIEKLLPQLVITASLANPTLPETRLIQVPKEQNRILCESLCLPCVSIIGILHDAPFSDGLQEAIGQYVPKIQVPKEIRDVSFLPVKINAIESLATVPVKRQKVK